MPKLFSGRTITITKTALTTWRRLTGFYLWTKLFILHNHKRTTLGHVNLHVHWTLHVNNLNIPNIVHLKGIFGLYETGLLHCCCNGFGFWDENEPCSKVRQIKIRFAIRLRKGLDFFETSEKLEKFFGFHPGGKVSRRNLSNFCQLESTRDSKLKKFSARRSMQILMKKFRA